MYARPASLKILKEASSRLAGYGISDEVAGHIDISTSSFDFLDTIVRNMEVLKR